MPPPTRSISALKCMSSFTSPEPGIPLMGGPFCLPCCTSPSPADTVRQPQCRCSSLLYPPHCWEQRDWSDGPDGSVWAKSHEWGERLLGCWSGGPSLGKEDRSPDTQQQGTCSRIPTTIHKDIPLPFLPSHPFANPTFLCTLNSSKPVKAPNQTRRDFTPFSLNLPQVELMSLYTLPSFPNIPSLSSSTSSVAQGGEYTL